MSHKKYAVILGARPNFVKAAPFFHQARVHPHFTFTVIHTGQHFDPLMSKIFFEEMGIPVPDIMLDIKGEKHTEKIGRMFSAIREALASDFFDGVIVFGDVNSTLAGALAASKNRIPLIHIEAGLRSHDRRMPEEINRVIVDHLSDLLLTSEPSGDENLKAEGIPEARIHCVGNIMIESLELYRSQIENSDILSSLGISSKSYFVATAHRQENTDEPGTLASILELLRMLAKEKTVIFPMHPGTAKKITLWGLSMDGLRIIDPLGYFDFIRLMKESAGVITDSGGIQEETTHLGVPCATIRDNTERPITLEHGSNKLFPMHTDSVDGILEHFRRTDFKQAPIPLWDKDVSKRIFTFL